MALPVYREGKCCRGLSGPYKNFGMVKVRQAKPGKLAQCSFFLLGGVNEKYFYYHVKEDFHSQITCT
jgi:hypothetical protein